ncbi:unnamed protein product [Rodentolepis nana]|uniref:DUF1084 domain-containing protein n=1 Tax=Rodentolepis nana TaxID=102285 RepID=A0A0R3TH18_RODNA|nr:unnamed protein product [Rodentolepis nana]
MPAPPYIQSETPRKSGASLGSYTLNNEVVSLYFLALLRAYMEAQDCVELSHFPDAKQTEEAMRLEVMKRLEQNVFISFGVLYVVIHLIFIFILWFDVRTLLPTRRLKVFSFSIDFIPTFLVKLFNT